MNKPLQLLLRPVSVSSPASAVASPQPDVGAKTGHGPRLSIRTNADAGVAAGSSSVPASAVDLELPSPSPCFPKDLASLTRLRADEVKTLSRDYALGGERVSSQGSKGPGTKGGRDGEESREKMLNKFLSYIGASFLCAH